MKHIPSGHVLRRQCVATLKKTASVAEPLPLVPTAAISRKILRHATNDPKPCVCCNVGCVESFQLIRQIACAVLIKKKKIIIKVMKLIEKLILDLEFVAATQVFVSL